MKVVERIVSSDGVTTKYIQETKDRILVETTHVNLPEKHIVCFSSQVGCAIGCAFCVSGASDRIKRSLSKCELVEECMNVVADIAVSGRAKPTLFSCMGEGEPLLNFHAVTRAFRELASARGLHGVRLAVSTSGIRPKLISALGVITFAAPLKLQVSLHGATDNVRMRIIPVAAPLWEIISAVRDYREQCGRAVDWNYVMCAGVNDDLAHARILVRLLGPGSHVKFNRLNPAAGLVLKSAPSERVGEFRRILEDGGISTEYYETDGIDINAACGQMSHRLRV